MLCAILLVSRMAVEEALMIFLREAAARGHANHGWLDTRHTFSFANYHDPNFMGFSSLRVINEDRIQPSTGFGDHSHKDMEIISYVLSGTIEHQDSMGHKEQVKAGEFQIMSAGTGVRHSEYNPSTRELLHFYQIWIIPDEKQLTPRYESKVFPKQVAKQLILSPEGRDGSLKVFQNMRLWRYYLAQDEKLSYQVTKVYGYVWLQIVSGELEINDMVTTASDGIAIADELQLTIKANKPTELLLFELS